MGGGSAGVAGFLGAAVIRGFVWGFGLVCWSESN